MYANASNCAHLIQRLAIFVAYMQNSPSPPDNTPPEEGGGGGGSGGGGSGGGGAWQKGVTTYYTSNEGGPRGKSGKVLTPFRSISIKLGQYDKFAGREVEIKGVGTFVVEDGCQGAACKDFDIYVGSDVENAKKLPNWQKGNIPIEYRWL
jgi:hypothetical protein